MLSVCLTLILTTSCGTTPATDCAWARLIQPSKQDVLTRGTKVQIVAHNRSVREFCRR